MDIILGQGCNDIRFGMLESEIIAQIGTPDKKYESDYDINLQYFSIKCEFQLSKEDYRLEQIECFNPHMKICSRFFLDRNKNELIPFINSKFKSELETEDYGTFEVYEFTDLSLSLYFEFNRLTTLSFSYFWSDDDEPVWQIDD